MSISEIKKKLMKKYAITDEMIAPTSHVDISTEDTNGVLTEKEERFVQGMADIMRRAYDEANEASLYHPKSNISVVLKGVRIGYIQDHSNENMDFRDYREMKSKNYLTYTTSQEIEPRLENLMQTAFEVFDQKLYQDVTAERAARDRAYEERMKAERVQIENALEEFGI